MSRSRKRPRKAQKPRVKPRPGEVPPSEAEVRLKPVLGLKPGVYLTVIYALVLLFVLFMLLFYKGIRDQGVYLRVRTLPTGAAVSVDGTYAGSTPCQILVRKGRHTVTVSRPRFTDAVVEDSFPGPVFGTLFVRPRRTLTLKLSLDDATALVGSAIRDYAASPNIPEILTDAAEAVYTARPEQQEQLSHLVDRAKYFVTDPAQLASLLQATALVSSEGGPFSAAALMRIVQFGIQSVKEHENSPIWLILALSQGPAKRLTDSQWFARFVAAYGSAQPPAGSSPAVASAQPGSPRLEGLTFRPIPGGVLEQGKREEGSVGSLLAHQTRIEGFYMSETEISARLYAAFLMETPRWRKSNLSALLADELVSRDYLAGWDADSPPRGAEDLPVVNVSYHAAAAFADWLTSKLPPGLAGYQARLPWESEWEWAARGGLSGKSYPQGDQPGNARFRSPEVNGPAPVGYSGPNGFGLRDMAGNVWEWCADWYSPALYLFSGWRPGPASTANTVPYGSEKVVRGGSWANEKELVRVYTRAAQPPAWCTPYLGFRVVLARKE